MLTSYHHAQMPTAKRTYAYAGMRAWRRVAQQHQCKTQLCMARITDACAPAAERESP
jgi:hypothetical protein